MWKFSRLGEVGMGKRTLSMFLALALALSSSVYAQTPSKKLCVVKDNLHYDSIGVFSKGLFEVSRYSDKNQLTRVYGLIDTAGNQVVPLKYHYMSSISDSYIRVGMDTDNNMDTGMPYFGWGLDKWGFINTQNQMVIPVTYDRAEDFSEGLALVGKDYQYIQKGILGFPDSTATGYKIGFVNQNGKVVVPLVYDDAKNFSEGLSVVTKDRKSGFVDKNGKIVIPLIYDNAESFSEGLAAVSKNGKSGFINAQGKVVIPLRYDTVGNFKEGLVMIGQGDKRGVINKQGKVVVQPIYDYVDDFSEGLALVYQVVDKSKAKCKYGFINQSGKVVIPLSFTSASSFSDGLAIVKTTDELNKNYTVIDKNGKTVLHYPDKSIHTFRNGILELGKNTYQDHNLPDTFGLIDKQGNEILPMKYSSISFDDEFAVTRERNGNSIIWGIRSAG